MSIEIDPAKIDQIVVEEYQSNREDILHILQSISVEYNYLPESALRQVADRMGMPLSQIYSMATFYKAFSLKLRGRHIINVCVGTACHVRGGEKILEKLERDLEIKAGETTKDLSFTLETVNCLGACALGPVAVIDGEYFGQMTSGKVGPIIKKFQKEQEVEAES